MPDEVVVMFVIVGLALPPIIPDKVKLEQEYLLRKSILLDLEIIIKTFTNVIFSKGVSH